MQKLTQEPTELSLSIDDHILQMQNLVYDDHIGKYLSSLRKLDDVITPKEGFET